MIGIELSFYADVGMVNEIKRLDKDLKTKNVIAVHAAYLLKNINSRLNITGHADERGNREYNLALSELRARAVVHELMLSGVSLNRITIISLGKEQPLLTGHNQKAWAQNRRVELHYECG